MHAGRITLTRFNGAKHVSRTGLDTHQKSSVCVHNTDDWAADGQAEVLYDDSASTDARGLNGIEDCAVSSVWAAEKRFSWYNALQHGNRSLILFF